MGGLTEVPCVVCGVAVHRRYERHRYCSLACWEIDPANARHRIAPKAPPRGREVDATGADDDG